MESVPSARRLFLSLGIKVVAARAYLAVRYSWVGDEPVGQLLLLAGLLAATAWLVWRLTDRPPTVGLVLGVAIGAAGADAFGLWLAGPHALGSFKSWVVGFVGAIVAATVFAVPPRWWPVLVLPSVAVVLATAAANGFGIFGVTGPVSATVTAPLVIGLLGVRLRSDQRAAGEDAAQLRSLALQAERARVRSAAQNASLAAARASALPLLREVAGGAVSPVDPAVQARARVAALAMRDELVQPGRLDPLLRHRLDVARAAGAAVRLGDGGRAAQVAAGLRLVERVLDVRPAPRTVVARFPDDGSAVVQVSPALVIDPRSPLGQWLAELPITVTHTGFATTLRATPAADLQQSPEGASRGEELTIPL